MNDSYNIENNCCHCDAPVCYGTTSIEYTLTYRADHYHQNTHFTSLAGLGLGSLIPMSCAACQLLRSSHIFAPKVELVNTILLAAVGVVLW